MKAQIGPADGQATPDIIAILNDLARLSQQVVISVPSNRSAVPETLLQYLLRLFNGQRGALLLTLEKFGGNGVTSAHKMSVRPFVSYKLEEEEARALLETATLDESSMQAQSCVAASGWMVGRIPLTASVDMSPAEPLLPSAAIVVVGWVGKDKTVLLEQGRVLFSSIANMVGTIIANMLLAERVQILESSSNHKAIHEMELLKAELLATMSHELRSPLASIKGYAATLLRHEQRISFEERHEFLLAINESSDRLAVLIDRLLEMSQLETGTITLEYAPVNVSHLVREAITAVSQRLNGQRSIHFDGQPMESKSTPPNATTEPIALTLRVEDQDGLSSDIEPVILADERRLREVVDNLLENAILYSPDGGTVEVVVRPIMVGTMPRKDFLLMSNHHDHDGSPPLLGGDVAYGQQVELRIADHGIGIPLDQLEHIFQYFHRVDTRLTREVNGLGLGLSISKRIVELHHGVIWAESELGHGSTFCVLLPVNLEG